MQLPVIFLPHLAVGVTKEMSNKRSAPHSWHGTILDLLDTYTEFKGLGQYVQNCLLMMMFSALPQIPTNTYKPVHINDVGTDLFSLHNSFKLTETKIIKDLEQKPSGERLKELGLTRGEERN